MPLYFIGALGVGILADRAWRRFPGWPRAVVILGLVVLTINRLWVNFPLADQKDKTVDTALEPGRAILADQPPRGAVVSGSYEENLSLDYLTKVWGERQDLRVVITDDFLQMWHAGEGNLFLTRDSAGFVLPQLGEKPSLSSAGLRLIEVRQEPGGETAEMDEMVDAAVRDGLVLLGYDRLPAAEGFHLALYWQAEDVPSADYAVSLRPTARGELLFHDGELVQEDHAHPVWGFYPTSRWAKGEVVRDDYLVAVPPELDYDGAAVVVYRVTEDGFEDLGTVYLRFGTSS
jgi:hypothetical protein